MNADSKSTLLYDNLDTTFVNLWSLLRNLTKRGFVGRVHVELKDYAADIFLNGSSSPEVREVDRVAGTREEDGELHRVVLRARESPGTISVFAAAKEEASVPVSVPTGDKPSSEIAAAGQNQGAKVELDPANESVREMDLAALEASEGPKVRMEPPAEEIYPTGSYQDWPAILATTGDLIGAIERGLNAAGEDFDSLFDSARLELADDYNFLDPMARAFTYANGKATLNRELSVNVFVSGLSEVLRRCVDRVAIGERARRVRERTALEMLTVARKHSGVLERSGFQAQLDRIAGTRVV